MPHLHPPPQHERVVNALTAQGEVRVGFARRWCVVGVQHVHTQLGSRGGQHTPFPVNRRAMASEASGALPRVNTARDAAASWRAEIRMETARLH
eukprot:4824767-Prymnesium_polylepis.1